MYYRTLIQELLRRAGVEAQIKQLIDDAAIIPGKDDSLGMVNLLRAILCAEMWHKNEQSKQPFNEAMSTFVGLLEWRINSH